MPTARRRCPWSCNCTRSKTASGPAADDQDRQPVPRLHPRWPAGLDERRARQRRDHPPHVQAAGGHPCTHVRPAARGRAARRAHLRRRRRRAPPHRPQAAADAPGLVGQAPRHRSAAGRTWAAWSCAWATRRGRDVVAVRRPGRAQRAGPALFRQHPHPHPPRGAWRPVPRIGQHRPQGRPLAPAAGPGPRRAAAWSRDRCRRHRARRQVRDRCRLCQPGLHQAGAGALGRRGAVRIRHRLHLRPGRARPALHLPPGPGRPRIGPGPPAEPSLRRSGRHRGLRRRAGSLGERAVLPPHPGRPFPARDTAPLLGLHLPAAQPEAGRHADRHGPAQRAPDRRGEAAGRAGQAGRPGLLPRRHQRPPHGRHRAGRAQPGRADDAQPVAAVHGKVAGHRPAA